MMCGTAENQVFGMEGNGEMFTDLGDNPFANHSLPSWSFCPGPDEIIENNRFEWTSSNAIMVRNSVDSPEDFPTGNLIIRGNTFESCGFDHTMQMAG